MPSNSSIKNIAESIRMRTANTEISQLAQDLHDLARNVRDQEDEIKRMHTDIASVQAQLRQLRPRQE